MIPIDPAPSPEDVAIQNQQIRFILKTASEILTPRESSILVRRYIDEATLNIIGKEHSISVERARQISNAALRKMQRRLAPQYFYQLNPWVAQTEDEAPEPPPAPPPRPVEMPAHMCWNQSLQDRAQLHKQGDILTCNCGQQWICTKRDAHTGGTWWSKTS